MDIKVVDRLPAKGSQATILVGISIGKNRLPKNFPDETKKSINRALTRGDLSHDQNQTVLLHDVPGLNIPRILLLRTGSTHKTRPAATVLKRAEAVAAELQNTPCNNLVIQLDPALCPEQMTVAETASLMTRTIISQQYRFTGHTCQTSGTESALKKLTLVVDKAEIAAVQESALAGRATAEGMALTRDLGNLAPNICTPEYLASEARRLARGDKQMKVTVLNEAHMQKLGMGAFLSVGQGSRQPPRLIAMDYRGGKANEKPIVLVGKGVTFDTGGISIKPSTGMDEMKYDMCGAATVFGVMKACQTLNLKLNVVGVIAAAENMPDGNASRPGDVVTTLSGQSVEILNTDAEGRLVLCDTLTWVERYKPQAVIDMATLTGACVVALGNVCSAVLGNDDELVDDLYQAGQQSADTTWPLPLWDEYQTQLDSNFADMANIGTPAGAGAITAACFLARFTETYRWAHLDIAGIAWRKGNSKGATGRPVPMLMAWLMSRV